MNKLESPFSQTLELWSVEEKQTFNQAFTKAKEIQHAIDAEINSIVTSKIFQDHFPSFSEKIPHIITPLLPQTSYPNEFSQIHNNDIRAHLSALKCYETFFTHIEKTVLLLGESLVYPLIQGIRSDNPLAGGISLRQTMKAKEQHQALQEVVAEKKEEMESLVVEALKVTQKYLAVKDEKTKFSIALEIVNNQMLSYSLVPLPVQLDLLCVCSRNSDELPLFFKKLAMELAKQIDEFDFKTEEKERKERVELAEGCSIS